jgi:hypothetical protein
MPYRLSLPHEVTDIKLWSVLPLPVREHKSPPIPRPTLSVRRVGRPSLALQSPFQVCRHGSTLSDAKQETKGQWRLAQPTYRTPCCVPGMPGDLRVIVWEFRGHIHFCSLFGRTFPSLAANHVLSSLPACTSLIAYGFVPWEKFVFWFLILVIVPSYNAGALAALTRT